MLEKDKSYTTIGVYLRNVKYIINEAIRNGIMKRSEYPFGGKKETTKYTLIVIGVSFAVMIFLGGLDFLFTLLLGKFVL